MRMHPGEHPRRTPAGEQSRPGDNQGQVSEYIKVSASRRTSSVGPHESFPGKHLQASTPRRRSPRQTRTKTRRILPHEHTKVNSFRRRPPSESFGGQKRAGERSQAKSPQANTPRRTPPGEHSSGTPPSKLLGKRTHAKLPNRSPLSWHPGRTPSGEHPQANAPREDTPSECPEAKTSRRTSQANTPDEHPRWPATGEHSDVQTLRRTAPGEHLPRRTSPQANTFRRMLSWRITLDEHLQANAPQANTPPRRTPPRRLVPSKNPWTNVLKRTPASEHPRVSAPKQIPQVISTRRTPQGECAQVSTPRRKLPSKHTMASNPKRTANTPCERLSRLTPPQANNPQVAHPESNTTRRTPKGGHPHLLNTHPRRRTPGEHPMANNIR